MYNPSSGLNKWLMLVQEDKIGASVTIVGPSVVVDTGFPGLLEVLSSHVTSSGFSHQLFIMSNHRPSAHVRASGDPLKQTKYLVIIENLNEINP